MSLDTKIAESIRQAVAEAGQSKALARQIIAWMTAVASGNEDPADKASASRHLELLYNETVIFPGDDQESL